MTEAGTGTVASRHVVANGVRCHYLEAGVGGLPLVLLHGSAIDSASLSFGPSLPELGEHHHVVALDWPGYGSSERPIVDMGMRDFLSLLGAFLDAMGFDRVHLAGFSMGGAVALGFSLEAPARVNTLTLIGSYGLDDSLPVPLLPYLALRVPNLSASVAWGMRRSRLLVSLVLKYVVFSNPELVTSELVSAVHEQLKEPAAARSFVAWLRGELRPFRLGTSYAGQLSDVAVPTSLLHGRNDKVVPWPKASQASERIAGSRLVVVPSCGHWVPREAPELFRRELLAFTRR
ncbi:MAG TPA: alpha/beta fold hydrolase [Trueperaceae bacterium]|nr:alpha/beta fold hydrolase [Trueperaceae bacterium]